MRLQLHKFIKKKLLILRRTAH